MKKAAAIILCAAGLVVSPAWAAKPAACKASAEASRALVLKFYEQALLKKQPRLAFERYVSPTFVEHKQDVATGTREGVVMFLEGLISKLPAAKWEVLRTVAEPKLVFLHASFVPAPGALPYAIADIFRVENCKIVEHWDIVAPPRTASGDNSASGKSDSDT